MHNILRDLSNKFYDALVVAYPELKGENHLALIDIAQSKQEKYGHYQCNTPMRLAKRLVQNPRQIAENLIRHIESHPEIEKLEVAGPGFINITLSTPFITETVQEMFNNPNPDPPEKWERIIVEFSSPNIAKELHVGHLRSTIIGDCLARVFEYLGHDVVRLNHVGDWGTAFGMLIAFLKEEHPEILTGKKRTDLSHLVEWYRESKKRFDHDPDFKRKSQQEVVLLQGGDPESLKAWEIICGISREAYQEIYDLLGIKLLERGESFYNPMLPKITRDLEEKGLIEVSDGAKCLFLPEFKNREGEPLPLMIQKSDGGYGYDTTDMAAMKHRTEVEQADRIIIVTDAGQSQHFQMIYKASIMAGYIHPESVRFDHVPFGLVLGPDGKKFRTRAGDTEKLVDLLFTATDKAGQIIEERNPELPQQEKQSIAKAIGLGAVKYADLSCHRTSDYTFSYDRMLRFEGNTAAFLMYSYVRIAGIKRKIQADIDELKKENQIILDHPSEVALGLHLLQFVEALDLVTNDLLPNRLTDYLYGLANTFSAFYRDCKVEGSPQEGSRLLLCEVAARTMKTGLHLLGVETVEKM